MARATEWQGEREREAILVLGRHPRSGAVKTRLGRGIGMEEAAEVYASLLSYTLEVAEAVGRWVVFAVPEEDRGEAARYRRGGREVIFQKGSDLGERMKAGFEELLERGLERIVLIGSDCPYLHRELLEEAFCRLRSSEVVFGPALDGGYYLVGQKGRSHRLFDGIPWSTGEVWNATERLLASEGIEPSLLPRLGDIDTLEDLSLYLEAPGGWEIPPKIRDQVLSLRCKASAERLDRFASALEGAALQTTRKGRVAP